MFELLPVVLFGVVLASLHFSVPLAYYAFLRRYVHGPWDLKVDKQYKPQITAIVPTYNESHLIERRLENMIAQEYPLNKLEILVIDSGSTDGTTTIVEEWLKRKRSINAKLIRESNRGGKFRAVRFALGLIQSTSVAVVLTDADAYWEPRALSEAMSFLADPKVGAVTGSISYVDDLGRPSEDTYRNYFNSVRVGESKFHSTPVHNGPLLTIRADLLRKIGLPNFPGSDDSAFGSLIALAGYRAIQVENAVVREYVRGQHLHRRVRRAQCLLLNFHHTKRYAKEMNLYVRSSFDAIWRTEWWLCVVNPWLLFGSVLVLAAGAIFYELRVALPSLSMGALMLMWKPYRTWVLQQLYLIIGAVRNQWTNEAIWNR